MSILNRQNNDVDVLIVGAGPTGLTMTCELLRRGITCRVLDKAAAPGMSSRAIGVQARTLEVFDRMGIMEDVLSKGVKIGVKAFDHDTLLLHLKFRFLASDAIPYPFGLMLPQNMTEDLLIALLHKEGGAVERQKELTEIRQEAEGVVVTVHNLQDDSYTELRASWLIGCDGAHSRVRKAIGQAFEGSTYDEEYLLGDVDLDWQRSTEDVYVWMHREGQFAAFPLPNNKWRLLATVPTTDGKDAPQSSVELLQRLMRERTGDSSTTISNPIWLSNFKINRRMVSSYRKGRVFLAGDAAHVHSPFGGQGMNTGIQDAFNLAWKLALVIKGKAPEALLDTYQQERLPIARKVLAETDQHTRIFFANNRALRFLRDRVVIPLLNRGFVQRRMLWEASELGINYRNSPLTQTASGGHAEQSGKKRWPRHALRPGDRAPDGYCVRLPHHDSTSFFQEFRETASQLVIFAGLSHTETDDAQIARIIQQVKDIVGDEVKISLVVSQDKSAEKLDWAETILLDPERVLHTRYGASIPTLYFIRPDGYIGACYRLSEGKQLLEYLGQWFIQSKVAVSM